MTDQATEPGQEQTAAPQEEKTLDQMLAEFDAGDQGETQPVSPPQPAAQTPDLAQRIDALTSYVEQDIADKNATKQSEGIASSVQTMKGVPELAKIPDAVVRAHLIATAYDTPGFDKAFEQRDKNPAAYKALLEKSAKDLASQLGPQPDAQITADMQAANAAVQGHAAATNDDRPAGPTQAEKNAMSKHQWDAYMRSQMTG